MYSNTLFRFARVRPAHRRMRALALGLLAAILSTAPVLADDTEVYQTHLEPASPATSKPNVLFIIDTSGSMSNPVDGPKPFDPGKSETFYDGGTGTCLHTRIYWSTDGTVPSCSTGQYFEKSALRCAAALEQLNQGGLGTYQDRVARYETSTKSWQPLAATSEGQSATDVECRADRGVHGQTDGSSDTYIVNGAASPWQASPSGEANWGATGDFYTLFSAKYMNYVHNATNADPGSPSRMDIVKAATNRIMAANYKNIFAGLMRFDTNDYCVYAYEGFCFLTYSGNKGGPVVFPVQALDTFEKRSAFQGAVDSLTEEGWTPLAETLYEAALYFRGEAPLFGTDPPTPNDLHSVPSSMQDGKYISPISLECQQNDIVYLTDGEPTYDTDADSQINSLLRSGGPNLSDTSCGGSDDCLDELAEFLAEEDQSSLPGNQHVNVYTIGFFSDQQLLANTAKKGNGRYVTATNALELSAAFQAILSDINRQTTTFNSPSVSVNAFNRITNRDELFFSLFAPSARAHWPGNIKRYRLACQGVDPANPGFCTDENGDGVPDPPIIVDANGNPAIDATTGFFKNTARSIWTDPGLGADGSETEAGGAANVIGGVPGADDPPNPARVVYTYTGAYTQSGTYQGLFTPPGTDGILSGTQNQVSESNTALTNEVDLLPGPGDGLLESFFYPAGRNPSEPSLSDLIKWTRGVDVTDHDGDGSRTDARHQLGDSLHGKPVLVSYGSTNDNPDITLYSINNDGFLQAIDADNGKEVFTFIPQELLSRVPELYHDNVRSSGRDYGLDGPLTVWFNDKNGNGILDAGAPDFETVVLYFGQRRGGNRYWALDVTDRSNPKLLWKIEGGVPGTAYQELGQTWSAMQPAKIKVNGTVRNVVVFAGGYAPSEDDASTPSNDSIGRGLFIADALTGERIWHASSDAASSVPAPELTFSAMTNSIPSDVNVFDITGDGLADRIYVGDTRGQLWRFDINNDNSGPSDLAIGARIAELQKQTASSTPGPEDNRRFFYRPDVTLAAPEDAPPFLAITIGSGYRAHPLNKIVQDRFYMIRDSNISNITDPRDYPAAITEADLANITTNLTPTQTQLFGTPASPLVGWFIELKDEASDAFVGEKVLADASVFNNVALFTTFIPPTNVISSSCQPNQGSGRVYAVNLFDGTPVKDLDESGGSTLTRADRHIGLVRKGIPPNVVILFSKMNGVVPVGFVATEQIQMDFSDAPVKTYWYQQEVQ